MARVKVTAKVIEDLETTATAEDLIHLSEGNEDISQVEVEPVRPRATGLLIGIKCSRVRDNALMYLTSFITTRIDVELAVVHGNYPTRL